MGIIKHLLEHLKLRKLPYQELVKKYIYMLYMLPVRIKIEEPLGNDLALSYKAKHAAAIIYLFHS